MIVYSTVDGYDAPRYYGTRTEALTDAKSTSKACPVDVDQPVTVERIKLVKLDKFAVLRILNQMGGYVEEKTHVATFREGKRVKV